MPEHRLRGVDVDGELGGSAAGRWEMGDGRGHGKKAEKRRN